MNLFIRRVISLLLPVVGIGLLLYTENIFLRFLAVFLITISGISTIYGLAVFFIVKNNFKSIKMSHSNLITFIGEDKPFLVYYDYYPPVFPGFISEFVYVFQNIEGLCYKGRSQIEASDRKQYMIKPSFRRYGKFTLKSGMIRITDIMGLTTINIKVVSEDEFAVYPVTAETFNQQLFTGEGGFEYIKQTPTVDSTDFYESRKYYPGDDPRRINWNLFARFEELFIREVEKVPPGTGEIDVIFVPDSDIDGEFNETASYMLSFVRMILNNGYAVSLKGYGMPDLKLTDLNEMSKAINWTLGISAGGDLPESTDKSSIIVFCSIMTAAKLLRSTDRTKFYYFNIFGYKPLIKPFGLLRKLFFIDRHDILTADISGGYRSVALERRLLKRYNNYKSLISVNSLDSDNIHTKLASNISVVVFPVVSGGLL